MIIEHKYENEVVFKEEFAVVAEHDHRGDSPLLRAHGLDSYQEAMDKGAEFISMGASGFRIDKRYVKVAVAVLEQWRAEQEAARLAEMEQMEADIASVAGVSEVSRGKVAEGLKEGGH